MPSVLVHAPAPRREAVPSVQGTAELPEVQAWSGPYHAQDLGGGAR
jgi:hypothetical protein